MTENYGVIYRDNLEPEHAETRAWFQNCFESGDLASWNGEVWRIGKVETFIASPMLNSVSQFIVEGSYVRP